MQRLLYEGRQLQNESQLSSIRGLMPCALEGGLPQPCGATMQLSYRLPGGGGDGGSTGSESRSCYLEMYLGKKVCMGDGGMRSCMHARIQEGRHAFCNARRGILRFRRQCPTCSRPVHSSVPSFLLPRLHLHPCPTPASGLGEPHATPASTPHTCHAEGLHPHACSHAIHAPMPCMLPCHACSHAMHAPMPSMPPRHACSHAMHAPMNVTPMHAPVHLTCRSKR